MKKIFLILTAAVFALSFVSCNPKDDDDGDGWGNTSLTRTTWKHTDELFESTVTFKDAKTIFHHERYFDDGSAWNYWGTYKYNGSNGQATLSCYGEPEYFTFKVEGNKLTISFDGEEIEHTKSSYEDPGNPPSDDPNDPSAIQNTNWKYQTGTTGDSTFLSVTVRFGTDNAMVFKTVYVDEEPETESYTGGFAYNAANGTGTITLNDVETQDFVGTATFSISGYTMTLRLLGTTYNLARQP